MMPIMLAPFDSSRSFKAAASFRCSGQIVSKGEPFDKNLAQERLLRQLYENHRIVYSDEPAKPSRAHKRVRGLLDGFVAAVQSHIQQYKGAADTAREAPGAEESTSATSATGTAPAEINEGSSGAQLPAAEGGEGGLSKEPDQQSEAAAPDQAASQQTSVDAEVVEASPDSTEAAAAPDGEAETAAAADPRDAKIDALMMDHSHTELLEKATGHDLTGLTKRTPKADIAAAIVDAGHA